MCGIAGLINLNKIPVAQASIQNMNKKLRLRGPDDEGLFLDGNLGLGHTRLSIIDLSSAGHQPMSDISENYWIVYNGELYNYQKIKENLLLKGHKFKSHSDTEVILRAYIEYGEDCVKEFNGMWAFCIYDKLNKKLFLSRDQFGIKPLYYYSDMEKFIFASNLEAILSNGIQKIANDKIIYEFLAYNLTQHSKETFYKNIYSLNPGYNIIFSLERNELKEYEWYKFQKREFTSIQEFKTLYIDAIRLRTIADVPVGSCLSGGVDSSSVVCILDKVLDYQIHTFSFIAPGSEIDESRYINIINDSTRTKPAMVELEEDVFLNTVDDYVYALEEPVTGLSAYAQYLVFKLVKKNGIKVVLDGQGGDEIFAGYEYYFAYLFYELLVKFHWFSLLKEIVLYYRNFKNLFAVKMFAFLLIPESLKSFFWKRLVNNWVNIKGLVEESGALKESRWEKMSLKDSLFLTLFNTSIPHNVLWEDKLSMHFSIESRVPILDYRLAEIALNLDSKELISNGITKVILKKILRGIVPDIILDRKDKIGFAAPVEEFIRKEKIKNYFLEIIESESFKNRPYWNYLEVQKIFYQHQERKINSGDTIWKWIHLELWLRRLESN